MMHHTPGGRFCSLLVSVGCWIAFASASACADLIIRNQSGVEDGPVDFGTTVRLDPKVLDLQIENTGPGVVSGLTASITGGNSADFELASLSATTIPAGGSITARLSFTPFAAGTRTALLYLNTLSTPTSPAATASLIGTGSVRFTPVVTGPGTFIATNYETGLFFLSFSANGAIVASHNSGSPPQIPTVPANGIITGLFGSSVHQFKVVVATGPPPEREPIIQLTKYVGGALDAAFVPPTGLGGGVVMVQADGKLIVSGPEKVVRLNRDGSADASFSVTMDGYATGGFIQPDGRIVIAGYFNTVNGGPHRGLARLQSNGSVDQTFLMPYDAGIERVAGLPDGKMMVFGSFNLDGHRGVARLKADGSLDGTFDAHVESVLYGTIYGGAVQPDGKVLIGGPVFIGGVEYGLVRFNTDGSVDTSFVGTTNGSATSTVSAMAIQKDGKIVIGGHFNSVNGSPRTRIARLNVDGSLDAGFATANAADDAVSCIAIQADGKILVAGVFDTVGIFSRPARVARLLPNGEVESPFTPGGGAGRITSVAMGAAGEIYLTGLSLNISGIKAVVKLGNEQGASNFESGVDFLSWTRTGAVPELGAVVFESSTDSGATWTKIGDGSRTSDGWRLDEASVPSGVFLRARGNGAISTRGFSLCAETKLVGRSFTALENWRLAKFGSPLNESTGHDRADADADGVQNLVEYGFELEPLNVASRALPSWSHVNGGYQIAFNKAAAAVGVNYGAEWSTTLAPDDWHPAEDLSIGDAKSFRVEAGDEPSLFYRLKVVNPMGEQ